MMKLFKNERGMASIIGIVILSMLSFLGFAFFTITKSETESTDILLSSMDLRREAQNVLLVAQASINDNESVRDSIKNKTQAVKFIDGWSSGGATCDVYGRRSASSSKGEIELMAVAERDGKKIRVIAYLKKSGADGRYFIKSMEK